jgi:hypothetical protein
MGHLEAWISAHHRALWAIGAASTVVSLALVALAPLILLRLPADHFVRTRAPASRARRALRVGLGVVLLLAGIAMLVLPGQGVITMIVGVSLLGLPIERSIGRFMLRRPGAAAALNKLRVKAGKAPFVFGEPADVGAHVSTPKVAR